jgi:hypothetical protein
MDGDIKKDILDVRKVIERSTSKVSLRDLEKKGFRKVKVLRAGDINQLIYKAVQTVLAKQPAGMGEEEREKVLAEAKAEYERQTKQLQKLQEDQDAVEQAKTNLETRLAQVNQQLAAEKNKILEARKHFEEEKRQLEREKSTISEKGFDAIQTAQRQVAEIQARLNDAERRARGAVPEETYNKLRDEARDKIQHLEDQLRNASGKVDSGELDKLRADMAQQSAQQAELIKEILGAAKGAGPGGDFEKSFKSMQQNLVDTMRKFAGSGMKGFDEASEIDLGSLLANQANIEVQTNINEVKVDTRKAEGVKDKLSKLRNMRGGGPK